VRDSGNLPEDWVEPFMFGTLLHDVGKPLTTVFPEDVKAGRFPKEREWTAWAHDTKGVAPGTAFMKRLTNERKLIDRTTAIIREHMQPFNLHQGGGKGGAWKRLHNRLRLDVLGWMCRCDHCGGPAKNIGDPDLEHEFSEHCWSRFTDLGAEPVKAVLMGRHLLKAGVEAGEHFTPMLQAAFDAQLDDESLTEEELLAAALSHESSPLREGTGG
jgi:tRNA nucleotidyltransferase (CCA-adding enzyme)